ncbi:sigma-70 family RNA polymerase sigma factor [Paenibacillus sp. YAF4_2]|uniref:sigma-70 family RNA polymerase sigma factor n=1 Tax=Paenibacillus sp. YAF4_2 TaxID=3233085 RepID=UPI003F97D7F9
MKHIQRYLIRLGATRADAEDIVQDTVYKGLLYLDSIVPDKFSAWLYRVALNRYYDLLRKKKRIQWSIDEDVVGGSEIPEEILLRNEQREEIEHVLESLSSIFKQLIILKYELDLRYQAHKMPDGTIVDPFPDSERFVYGFGVGAEDSDVSEKKFLGRLEVGLRANRKYKQEYERIYDYLRKEKEKPNISDVRIIGVVVTGTADSLKALQGQKYLKAAVLGAVVDKY